MERTWKLGQDCAEYDNVLDPITFEQIITAVYHNRNGINAKTVREVANEYLEDRLTDFRFLIENNIDEIIEAAIPEEDKPLVNHPNWPEDKVEALAQEIYRFLLDHQMWLDVSIYYNGKRMSTAKRQPPEFKYNGEPFIEEDMDPRDYTEYVANPHILTMVFEGTLYEILNGYYPGWTKMEYEFQKIFEKYGCYYEMGHAWDLTVYEKE